MPFFRYQALNAEQQVVSGELFADSVSQAIAQVEAEGLAVQSIGYSTIAGDNPFAQATASATAPRAERANQPSQTDDALERAALEAHMGQVIERGRPILPALRAYAQELDSRLRRQQLLTVVRVLEGGDAAEATAKLSELPSYWIPLLSAATSSRDPGRVLRQFLKESQQAEELRRQWWMALAYPIIVVALALTVFVALAVFVIPVFREMFESFGLRLPGLTRAVFAVAAWITTGRVLLDLAIAIGIAAVLYGLSRLVPRSLVEWLSDRFGTLLSRSTAIARFAQFMADLLEAELDVPSALRIAGFATKSARIRRAAWRLARDMASGQPVVLHHVRPFVTAAMLHALRAEMSAKSRVKLLSEVGACHAARSKHFLSWTHGLIEPIAIAAVGLVVGMTVIALFLPLVSLVQGLS